MTKKERKKTINRSIPEEVMEMEALLESGDYPVRLNAGGRSGIDLGTGDTWNSLLCYCLAFWRVQPWQYVTSEPNFMFESPFYSAPCVGNIMGQGNQSFGLVVFPSEKIWEQYIEASQSLDCVGPGVDPVYELTQRASWCAVDFVPWRELSPEGRTLIEQTSWNGRTADGIFPDFLSYPVGYIRRLPNISEVLLLDRAIRGALLLSANHQAHQLSEPDMIHTLTFDNKSTLALVKKENLSVEEVKKQLPSQEPVKIHPPRTPEIDSVDISGFDLTPYRAKPGVVWELAVERMRSARIVDPATHAVTFPIMIVALDSDARLAYPPEVVTAEQNPLPGVLKVLMAAAQESGYLPDELHIKDEKLQNALSPIIQECGVKLILAHSLPAVNELLEAISEEY